MRRSRIDIIIDVLEVAKIGVNKTSVVYKCNLNFKLAEKYLNLLQKHGMIEKLESKFITTNKGRIFSQKAKEINLLI